VQINRCRFLFPETTSLSFVAAMRVTMNQRFAVGWLIAALSIGDSADASAQVTRVGQVPPTWTLTEELRLEDDDAEKSFGEVRGVVATRKGTMFVLDYKAQEIRVFDATGKFLRLAARRGNGPGEITNANGMLVGPDDVVWTNDPGNERWSSYNADGQFVRQLVLPIRSFGYLWTGAIESSGRILDLIYVSDQSVIDPATNRAVSRARIRRVHPATGAADTVDYPLCSNPPPPAVGVLQFRRPDGRGGRNMNVPFLPRPQTVLTRQGFLWCTPSSEYRLSIHRVGDRSTTPFRELVRLDVPAPAVSAAERKEATDRVDSIARNFGPLVSGSASAIPKNKPVIASLFADDQGRVWVRRTDTPAEKPEFDVFDPAGRQAARVRAPAKIGSQVFLTGNLLYTVVLDEFDVASVVRYRINR
jgi:hypothetical protein